MARKVNKPLGFLVVEKVGIRRAIRVFSFVAAWGLASDAVGHPVTMQEYTDYWRQSLATTYRERDAFKMVWPDLDTPEPIWSKAREHVTAKRPDLAITQLMAVTV